jgi:hypothetical protein
MSLFLFYVNNEVVYAFDNKDVAKKCILDFLISKTKNLDNKAYINKYKTELISLYNYTNVIIENQNYKVQKIEITKNIVKKPVKNQLNVKCRNMSHKDLNKKISMLRLSPLYNC